MKKVLSVGLVVFLGIGFALPAGTCTTILVTKGASSDGSVFVSHSDDDELGDQRLIYVPAMDHPAGSKRAVYYDWASMGYKTEYSPIGIRYVGEARGPGYIDKSLPQSEPLGYIPQVAHTYAYFDGNYAIMNEHQLMMGECTNGAKVFPEPEPGKRIMYSAELSRIAMERCKTAREAVKLMGEMIETYGYYGTGETLLVGDPNEGWVFEMCGYDKNASDGLWVAQRVPDGTVFAAANEFRIREVDPDNPNILHATKLFQICEEQGWWNPKMDKLDWLKAVSLGEYNHPYYSLRRVWSIFSRLQPSAKFSPWVEGGFTKAYPFSVKPDQKLAVEDVMALHRNVYEGTQFDQTKGPAAGPFGTPTRYFGPYDGAGFDIADPKRKMWGSWERPISVYYCGYLFVNQGRSWLPDPIGGICWYGPDKPDTTCFVPFHAGMTNLPMAYQHGRTDTFDRKSAWWAFNFVANWAELNYEPIHKEIFAKQQEYESKEIAILEAVETAALQLYKKDPELAREYLTNFGIGNAERIVEEWWTFSELLIAKYDDGFIEEPGKEPVETGYPEWWLKQVGYADGPITYERPTK